MANKKKHNSQKKNFTKNREEGFSPKRSSFPKINIPANLLSIFTRVFFFLFSFWFLGVYNAELLYKLQACSMFLNNPVFAADILNQSAGFLIYISRFLTQFLYYPLLGALLLSLGISGIEWWISRLFKIPFRYFYLSFIPPALILLTQTSIGYALYYKFETSVVFSLILGVLFVLLLFAFYRKIKNFRWGVWIALLVFLSLFFVIGVYAFVALMIMLTERIVNKEKYALPLLTGALLIVALLPLVSGKYIFYETYIAGLISPLPNPFFENVFIFSLVAQVVIIFYPVLSLFKGFRDIEEVSGKVTGINLLLFCISLFAIFYFSFRDSNFRLELKLQHLTEKQEWAEIIEEADKVQTPTKSIAVYRAIALANTDQLSLRLFDFPYQFKPATVAYMMDNAYLSDIYFYGSFVNVAYLWDMEFWVGTGANFSLLKQMALCAMLSGEKELASKYLNLLKQSLFYKKWAEEHSNNPDILTENPAYKQIKQYMPEEDFVIPSKYPFPFYYQCLGESFAKNVERCILASLYTKNFGWFMQIMAVVRTEDELPDCIQEALIIYAMLNNNFAPLERFKFNKKLEEKVVYCVNECSKYKNNPKLVEEKLRKRYKGTYCYYYFFANPNLFTYEVSK